MMLLYDSDIPAAIPDGVAAAGYCSGYAAAAWKGSQGFPRFPNARRINVFASVDDGDSFDVENGDITPAQAPGCVLRAHARGVRVPWVYCNRANGPAVEVALRGAGIARDQVALWIATLDGTQLVTHWNDGTPVYYPVAAVQYLNAAHSGGHYDISIVYADFGGSTQQIGEDDLTPDQASKLNEIWQVIQNGGLTTPGTSPDNSANNWWLVQAMNNIAGAVQKLAAAVEDVKGRVELIEQAPAIGAEHTTPPGP